MTLQFSGSWGTQTKKYVEKELKELFQKHPDAYILLKDGKDRLTAQIWDGRVYVTSHEPLWAYAIEPLVKLIRFAFQEREEQAQKEQQNDWNYDEYV